jgi:hypothetical protein
MKWGLQHLPFTERSPLLGFLTCTSTCTRTHALPTSPLPPLSGGGSCVFLQLPKLTAESGAIGAASTSG